MNNGILTLNFVMAARIK